MHLAHLPAIGLLIGAFAVGSVSIGIAGNVRPFAPGAWESPNEATSAPPAVRPGASESAPRTPPRRTAQRPSAEGVAPPIALDPPLCDFGFVAPGRTPTKAVKLTNTGDKPLMILAVAPSCKCTTVKDLVGTEIAPGASVELQASMRAQSGINDRRAEVKVLFDGYDRAVAVPLMIETSLPIRVVPGYINAVAGRGRTGRLVLESLDKRPFSVCSFAGRAPSFVGFDPAVDEPRNQYVIEYDVGAFKEPEMQRYLCIETDHPDCPLVDVFFRHEATNPPNPTFKMNEYRYSFGRVEEGSDGTFLVEINDLPDGEVLTEITTSLAGATVKWDGDATTDEDLLTTRSARITPPEGFLGLLYAPFTIHTNLRQQELAVFGLVVPKGHTGCLGLMSPLPAEPRSLVWSPDATTAPASRPAANDAKPALKPNDLAPVTGGQ